MHAANQKSPQHRLAQLGADPLELCSCPAHLLPTSLPSSNSYTCRAYLQQQPAHLHLHLHRRRNAYTHQLIAVSSLRRVAPHSVLTSLPRKLFISSIERWLTTTSKRVAKVHTSNSHNPLSLRVKYSLFSLKCNSSRRLSSLHKRVGKRRHSLFLLCVRADKLRHVLVSWQWSGSRPSGEVAEVKEHGELPIQSNKGNTIKNNADPEDPALNIAREGNDVVKRAHEVEVEEHANGGEVKAPESEKKEENKEEEKKDEEEGKQNGIPEATESQTEETKNGEVASEEAKTREKRKAEEPASEEIGDEEGEKDEASEKKQKTEKTNGAKKSRGRPKKGEAAEKKEKKAPAKKREPKKAATENGEPRRSARNRS